MQEIDTENLKGIRRQIKGYESVVYELEQLLKQSKADLKYWQDKFYQVDLARAEKDGRLKVYDSHGKEVGKNGEVDLSKSLTKEQLISLIKEIEEMDEDN